MQMNQHSQDTHSFAGEPKLQFSRVSVSEYTAARGSSIRGVEANFYTDQFDKIGSSEFKHILT